MGQPLYCSAADAGVWEERDYDVTQQYCLASMAACLSSSIISCHSLLPNIRSIHLSAVNISPRPGIAPHSLNSSSQPLCFPGDQHSCLGCRPYEDCCGSRCCVRALSIQRLWYFWFLLMMGVLFCCGAGFFIRRRMYPPPLIEEPAFNVSYTRQPQNPTPGAQPLGLPHYTDPGGSGMNPAGNPVAMAFQVQPNSSQGSTAYPPPPSYCNTPPPPYEQVVKTK
ncbi:vesicular, overexpressed in cancer, prosurvival protein 1 isoform X1 [Bubalus bubalis]|uniref:vesicular, overexpressed in cancer, prosurvival protein 1 isoform X1 n=1 Tax=Bubalus bubalis TaxID=89462 RepID=UPI000DBC4915|nr:vesicular, overexpressed in cancer, prosurvival protein 1 isoform X1 [Bubalus bubalis]